MGWFDDNPAPGGFAAPGYNPAPPPGITFGQGGTAYQQFLASQQSSPLAGMTVNPQGSGSTTAITEPGWTPGYNPLTPYQGGTGATGGGGQAPPYVNMSDPVQAFVWQGFQSKGVTPRDAGDFQYWVDNVNRTGGLTDQNKGYWTSRFAQPNGGLGDYGNGSPQGGGASGGFGGGNGQYQGGPFQMPSLEEAQNSPGYQFALQQGLRGVESSAAAKGTLLTGGTLKALQGYGTGLADQTYGNVFSRALQANTQNYNQLYGLAGLGVNAATGAAG